MCRVSSSRAVIRRAICFAAPAAASIKFRSMQAKFETKFEKFYSPRPHLENVKFSLLKFDVIFAFVLMEFKLRALLSGCKRSSLFLPASYFER